MSSCWSMRPSLPAARGFPSVLLPGRPVPLSGTSVLVSNKGSRVEFANDNGSFKYRGVFGLHEGLCSLTPKEQGDVKGLA